MPDIGRGTSPPLVRVLGFCEIERRDGSGPPPSPMQRRLLARLAAAGGEPLSVGVLAEAAWDGDAPRTAKAALLNQVSRMRSVFGDDLIVTVPDGYALGWQSDLDLVAGAVHDAEQAIGGGEHAAAETLLTAALARWSGRPFADLDHVAEVEPARRRAAELRQAAENLRLVALLRAGRTGSAVPEAERLVSHSPYDEQRRVFLAQALELAGRRGDALAVFDRARRSLRDGLGLDPGPVLANAEATMLGIDPDRPEPAVRDVVGRDAELDEIAALVADGGGILVRGESGVGVSSLLSEVARRLRREHTVARTECSRSAAVPLAALVDLLDQIGGSHRRIQGVAEQLAAVVRRMAAERPVLLVIDDLDLAGPSTLAVLCQLARVDKVAVVASAHGPLAGPDEEWRELLLGPLDDVGVAELASRLTGRRHAAESEAVRWLMSMSGGNPLYVESLLDTPVAIDTMDDRAIGRSLADQIRHRVEVLGPTARWALEVAAVAGAQFPVLVLEELAPPAGVAACVDSGLIDVLPERRARFRHVAVQRVVALDVPTGRRAEIHHAIAQLFLDRALGSAAVVAHHSVAASEVDPVAAMSAARRAALEASAAGAHRDAAEWFARAAAVARTLGDPGVSDRIRCSIGEGDELRLAGDPRQETVLAEAFEAACASGDDALVAEAAYAILQLGFTTGSGRSHDLAQVVADRAMALATGDHRARVMAAASLGCSMTGEVERCRDLFLDAEALAGGTAVRRQVLPFAYMALGAPEDLEPRAAAASELLDLAIGADDPVARFEARHLAFSVAIQRADGPAVREHLDDMVALVDEVGDVGRRWQLLYQSAAVAHLDDDLERSERLNTDAMNVFAPVSATRALAAYGGQLLAIRMAQGRMSELADTFELMVADQPELPGWHAALSFALVDLDAERAASHAARALADVPRDFLWLAAHLIGGRTAAMVGGRETAAGYLERLNPWSGRACWQGTCSYGPVDTTIALLHRRLGEAEAVDHHARRATEVAERLGAPVFLRDLAELGLTPPR